MKTAYLALGSNLGDRLGILREAGARLKKCAEIRVWETSSVYETVAVGGVEQPDFLNLVMRVETTLSPLRLLAVLQRIETELGRERRERWGPRIVDLDLLWFDGEASDDPQLSLPHPRAKERSFVLTPWAEIAPGLKLDGETIAARAATIGMVGVTRIARWTAGAGDE